VIAFAISLATGCVQEVDSQGQPVEESMTASCEGCVDLFYCESLDGDAKLTSSRKGRAEGALQVLQALLPEATLRVRPVPSLVQARPGYRTFVDQVRYPEGQNDLARTIATRLNVAQVRYPADMSPPLDYVSVWYCGPSSTPGGDCCAATATPGCTQASVKQCTCALDDYCCKTAWDAQCVTEARSSCGACAK